MNRKFACKRSGSTYLSSKMAKLANIPSKETVQQTSMPFPDATNSANVTHEGITSEDWLTAICQSLGEVPAVFKTSTDIDPQLIIDMPATDSNPAQVCDETATLQNSIQVLGFIQ